MSENEVSSGGAGVVRGRVVMKDGPIGKSYRSLLSHLLHNMYISSVNCSTSF